MEGKTHRIFAPLFAFGTSIVLTRSGLLKHQAEPMITIAIATAASTVTAVAPDADLHSYKPFYVIWGVNTPNKNRNGSYSVRTPTGAKSYRTPRGLNTKLWATLFRFMGVTKHRDFKSHSPLLWGAIWYALYNLTAKSTIEMAIGGILSSIVLGLGLGYMSHIVGDMPNKSGVPILPFKRNFSPVRLLPNFMQGFFRSGNPGLNFLILFLTINGIIILIFGESVLPLYRIIIKTGVTLLDLILDIFFGLLKSLIKLIRGN